MTAGYGDRQSLRTGFDAGRAKHADEREPVAPFAMYAIDEMMMLIGNEVAYRIYARYVEIAADRVNHRFNRAVEWIYGIKLRDESRVPQPEPCGGVSFNYETAQVASVVFDVGQVL